ncbi:hypothetical protein [Salinispora pacifica]|uniref:hypothetical protein n=1 Tax=Salinispora pacifica TaxID=351187 RepID=UPI000378FFC4|nr:hypothetical protein [Salinispora pacifica]
MSTVSGTKGRGLQVTIKYGKGHEETWVSFAGSREEIHEDIVEYFDLDPDSLAGLSLSDVVVSATNLAHAKGNLAGALGATVIPPGREYTPAAQSRPQGDVWNAVGQAVQAGATESAEPTEPKRPMLALIEAEKTENGLKRLYAEHPTEFRDAGLLEAWKARGRALRAAT